MTLVTSLHAVELVFTDGACSGNPGPGGWAWASSTERHSSGGEVHTTNQRMEIRAALEAVLAHAHPVEIRSDSAYVVNCFNNQWWPSWVKNGWRNARGKDVANRDLWEPLIDEYRSRMGIADVTFSWVKGHSGDLMNDFVDQLAVRATQQAARR